MPLTKATQNVVEGIVSTGSTGVSAGSFQVGQQYKITSLGTTTQSQWNTIAGTTGQTYVVGSLFTAATAGASSGNGAAAVARTLANRFADVVNVKDFGAVGDGVANDTAAFNSAVSFAGSNRNILVPAGTYNLNGNSLTFSNKFILIGNASITNGSINGGIIERQSDSDGSIVSALNWSTIPAGWQQKAVLKVGGQYASPAFSIGSGNPNQSNEGMLFYADGHSDFFAMQPERQSECSEINIYNSGINGSAASVIGTNQLAINTAKSYIPFNSSMVGKFLMWNGGRWKVVAFNSATNISVNDQNDNPVTFASAVEDTYIYAFAVFKGKCDVNGTSVTRVSGNIFPGYGVLTYSTLEINGTVCTHTGPITDNSITLSASLGTLTNVDWIWYCFIEGETTAIRLNHANQVGEQLCITTIGAAADDGSPNYFIKSVNSAGGKYRNIVLNNNNSDGIVVAPNGASDCFVGVGKNRRNPSCQLDVNGEIRSNYLNIYSTQITNYSEDVDTAEVAINYTGYNKGSTRFRNTSIYDGKGNLVGRFGGTNRNFSVNAVPISSFAITSGGSIAPDVDGIHNCGGASNRWNVVYAATGTINTSDQNEKQQIRELSNSEKSVAIRLKSLIRAFKFNDAVEKKGDNARIHFGIIAQDVEDAFNQEGLDASKYGLFCYDEWNEIQEEKDEKGNIMQEYRAAGSRRGVRYEELLAFIISAI
jgi:hypothetical protein